MDSYQAVRDTGLRLASHLAQSELIDTPCFVFDQDELASTLQLFTNYLPGVQLYYAVKANPLPLLLRFFMEQGLGFDVASAYEVAHVRKVCGDAASLVMSNPIKDVRAVQAVFAGNVESYTFDNARELQKIVDYRQKGGYHSVPNCVVRIRIESSGVQIDLNEKFGCSLKEAVGLIELARDLGLNPNGVQFHVGTQSLMAQNYGVGIESAMFIARALRRKAGIEIDTINIGGGFPDPHLAAKNGINIQDIFREIGESCARAQDGGFRIVAEPGRVLVSSAATFISRVIGIHDRNGKRWVYVDDGAYGAYSGRFFDHKTFELHPVPLAGRDLSSSERISCVIAGPTCDSIDVVSENGLLPEDLQIGDLLCSFNMGAYSASTASRFNGYGTHSAVLARLETSPQGERAVVSGAGDDEAVALAA